MMDATMAAIFFLLDFAFVFTCACSIGVVFRIRDAAKRAAASAYTCGTTVYISEERHGGYCPFSSISTTGFRCRACPMPASRVWKHRVRSRCRMLKTASEKRKEPLRWNECSGSSGADGNRNHDLFDANEALYQLSYSPVDVVVLRMTTRLTIPAAANKCKSRVSRRRVGDRHMVDRIFRATRHPVARCRVGNRLPERAGRSRRPRLYERRHAWRRRVRRDV